MRQTAPGRDAESPYTTWRVQTLVAESYNKMKIDQKVRMRYRIGADNGTLARAQCHDKMSHIYLSQLKRPRGKRLAQQAADQILGTTYAELNLIRQDISGNDAQPMCHLCRKPPKA